MRTIAADIAKEKGQLDKYFNTCISAGRGGEIMRHVAYEQLKMTKKECGFQYIRFHGLFHEEMAIVTRDKDGKLSFNFQYVDLLFDSLLDIGFRPIVELGMMPDIMAKEKAYHFWWKINISMPEKMEEWHQLVEETVRHFTERYGEEEVKNWFFEVWNEPNHKAFFTESDNPDAYFQLYESAADAVKSVCPDYKVGGPVTAGLEWLDEFLAYCKENNTPVDFIAGHRYCVTGTRDAEGNKQTIILPADFLIERINDFGDRCKEAGLPCLITEWSSSYNSRDHIHDSYFNAVFILEAIKRCAGHVDMLSYWVYTDIFEELRPPETPFHGGFGLITVQSVPKPSYYLYTFLNRLADTELVCEDESAYVCRSENEAQILFWNYVHPDMTDKTDADVFDQPFLTKKIDDANVKLSGLDKNKSYHVTVETLGYHKGDTLSAYMEENYPVHLSKAQVEELKEKAKPAKTEFEVMSDDSGNLCFALEQTENQIDFITIAI